MTIPNPVTEAVARAICKSGKFETGEGTCAPICMEFLGDPRKNGCGHACRVHAKLVNAAILAHLLAIREPTVDSLLSRLNATFQGERLSAILVNPDGPEAATLITTLVEALDQIRKEANIANTVIRLGREAVGSGRVKVATAMHRIEITARKAHEAATKEPDHA